MQISVPRESPSVGPKSAQKEIMLNINETNRTPDNDNTETKGEPVNMDTQQETTVINPNEIALIEANLRIVQDQAKELEEHTADLLARLKLSRGTGDVTEDAKIAQQVRTARLPRQARPPRQPKEQVEATLHGVSMNIPHIAKATGLSINKVTEAVRSLRADQKIVNVGSEDFPQWTYKIGDKAGTQELNAEVKRLITERPMTTQELMHFTGARLSRVSGALINLQRTEERLLNRGTARRAKWFLVDDRAVVSRLPPKS